MEYTFDNRCLDCKYYKDGKCTHEHAMYCPHCDYEYEKYEDCNYEDSEDEVECISCGRKFDLEIKVTKEFSTKRSLCEMPDGYNGNRDEEDGASDA